MRPVTIIRAGRAAETGTFDELRHLTRTTVVVETAEPIGTLSDLPGVHDLTIDHTHAQFSVDTGELNRILERLVEYNVRSLTSSPPTLEELFMRHYGEDIASPRRRRAGGSAMSGLRGTIALTGLALKRDRLKLPAYVLGPTVLMAGDGRDVEA